MSAAPAQMLTEWLVDQQKVAGQHLQSVKTCITLLEHTTRLAGVAEGDIRGLDSAAETVEAPLSPDQLGVSLPGPARLPGTPGSGSSSGGTAAHGGVRTWSLHACRASRSVLRALAGVSRAPPGAPYP